MSAGRCHKLAWAGLFGLAVFVMPMLAQAQPTEDEQAEGRDMATAAMTAYQNEDYFAAIESFRKAAKLYPTGQVLRMTGYTLIALQKWTEAAEMLDESLKAELKPLVPRDAEHAEDQLAMVLTHIATIEVRSNVRGATVSIDGGDEQSLPLKMRIDEGTHRFVVSAEGHQPATEKHNLEGGSKATIALDPTPEDEASEAEPVPVDEPEPTDEETKEQEAAEPESDDKSATGGFSVDLFPHQLTVGMVSAGLGVAIAGVAIGSGVYGMSLRSSVEDNVTAHNATYGEDCSQSDFTLCQYDIALINQDGARADSLQTAGLALGITAGVLVAAGAAFIVLAPDGPLAADNADGPDKISLSCSPSMIPASAGDAPTAFVGCHGSF